MAPFLGEKIQVRLPRDILKQLDNIAKGRLLSRSDVVREAILAHLKK
ncbi:MAG TPA: ribbon-helix-helix domain-containing protein [Candidatus Nanoarchaeia archaeon]|nr:ribbon-helix-helix domain-containing protein [Candidatus Nanoarchaeia archaeon]